MSWCPEGPPDRPQAHGPPAKSRRSASSTTPSGWIAIVYTHLVPNVIANDKCPPTLFDTKTYKFHKIRHMFHTKLGHVFGRGTLLLCNRMGTFIMSNQHFDINVMTNRYMQKAVWGRWIKIYVCKPSESYTYLDSADVWLLNFISNYNRHIFRY